MLQTQSAQQFVEQIVQIVAAAEAVKVLGVLRPGLIEVETVEIGIVQEVTLDAVHFLIHLAPFGARIDADFEIIHLEPAVARLHRSGRSRNEPSWSHAVEHFLAVRGNREA